MNTMNHPQLRRFSTCLLANRIQAEKSLELPVLSNFRKSPIPVPHRTIPEPKGHDLDYVNVAHSYLIHCDWDKLEKLVSGLTPFRIKHIMLKTRKDYVLTLEFFKRIELQNPKLRTLDVLCIILHILTKNYKFKSSELILRKILEMGSLELDFPHKVFDALLYSYRMCDSSPRVFDALFKTYAHLRKFRNATDVFRSMKEYGFFPTVESCNAYLSALNSLNRMDIALAFYKEIRRCRISPNVYTLNMVIGALCKVGKLEKAIELYKEMEEMGLKPNVATYNTMIAGYCSKGLLSSGAKLKSLMQKNDLHPSDVTYNILINALCKDGKLQEASKLFIEMKNLQVAPNTVTYNTLIRGYGEAGNIVMGGQLFEEMAMNGIKADILTYNVVIIGLCKQGKTKKAANMVKELDKEKLAPNASTFAALINGQCVRNNAERAFQLCKIMMRSGCHPNEQTFKTVLHAFIRNEDYDGAVLVLKEMMARSMAPGLGELSDIFNGLCICGKEGLAFDLCKEIESRHRIPEGFIISCLGSEPNTKKNDRQHISSLQNGWTRPRLQLDLSEYKVVQDPCYPGNHLVQGFMHIGPAMLSRFGWHFLEFWDVQLFSFHGLISDFIRRGLSAYISLIILGLTRDHALRKSWGGFLKYNFLSFQMPWSDTPRSSFAWYYSRPSLQTVW